jgi:hypothetical protein
MAARFRVNQAALDRFARSAPVKAAVAEKFAKPILEDAKDNLASMGAVDTGALRDSGRVVEGSDGAEVVFEADYAALVHEGDGSSRNKGPRPYLANAAFRERGDVKT